MAIKKWHYGKLVILWAWGLVLVALTLQVLEQTQNFVFGFLLIGALLAVPLALSIITWKWLSGKEQ